LLSVGDPRGEVPQVLSQNPPLLLLLPPPLHLLQLPPPPGWGVSPLRGEQRFSPSSSSSWCAGQRWGAIAAACGVEAGGPKAGGGCGGMCDGELGVQESQLRPPTAEGGPFHTRGHTPYSRSRPP
jgi:hypothetical protein